MNISYQEFIENLSKKTPVPGGGAASALCGALAAALTMMVGNYSVDGKKYDDVRADVKILLKKADELKNRLIELIDKDAEAFEPLSQAYKISKDDPERADLFESACLNAALVPLDIVKTCGCVLDITEQMLKKGNKMLASDVGCAAILSKAAMESAALNVYVNTAGMLNEDEAFSLNYEVMSLLEKYIPIADDISSKVRKSFTGK